MFVGYVACICKAASFAHRDYDLKEHATAVNVAEEMPTNTAPLLFRYPKRVDTTSVVVFSISWTVREGSFIARPSCWRSVVSC